MYVCMYSTCVQCLWRPEEGLRLPGAGFEGGYWPHVGAENWTRGLLKSSLYSELAPAWTVTFNSHITMPELVAGWCATQASGDTAEAGLLSGRLPLHRTTHRTLVCRAQCAEFRAWSQLGRWGESTVKGNRKTRA